MGFRLQGARARGCRKIEDVTIMELEVRTSIIGMVFRSLFRTAGRVPFVGFRL